MSKPSRVVDPTFDTFFRVEGDGSDRIRDFLSDAQRQILLTVAIGIGRHLHVGDSVVMIEVEHVIGDADELAREVDAAVNLARTPCDRKTTTTELPRSTLVEDSMEKAHWMRRNGRGAEAPAHFEDARRAAPDHPDVHAWQEGED